MEEKEILRSLETLNRQFITLRESRAYTSGAKIMRLKTKKIYFAIYKNEEEKTTKKSKIYWF